METRLRQFVILLPCTLVLSGAVAADRPPAVSFKTQRSRIQIRVGDRTVAEYVPSDARILRPYFTHIHTHDGQRVTRQHPPQKGGSTDHATMHPGLWLAFGDISGADFWRNKATVRSRGFTHRPAVKNGVGLFVVKNRYQKDGKTVCDETCRHTIRAVRGGYLITWDSTFGNDDRAFVFGDQEEMGLGLRINDKLRVRGGNGAIRNSDGKRNEKQVRGTNADWAAYSGVLSGRHVGAVLMPHPKNFRRSWYHARNYGFLAANPFGRKSLTGGKVSRVVVPAGKTLRLRFAVYVYSTAKGTEPPIAEVYRQYAAQQ